MSLPKKSLFPAPPTTPEQKVALEAAEEAVAAFAARHRTYTDAEAEALAIDGLNTFAVRMMLEVRGLKHRRAR